MRGRVEVASRSISGQDRQTVGSLVQRAPVLMWASGCGPSRTAFNERWQEFTGRDPGEDMGEGWLRNVHPDDFNRLLKTIEAAAAQHTGYQIEYRLRRHNGEYRWLLEQAEPSADPEAPGFTGVCLDVTGRYQSNPEPATDDGSRDAQFTEPRDGGLRFEELIQNVPGVLWEARGELGARDYRVTFVSEQIEEMLGYSLKEARGADNEDIFGLMHPDDRQDAYSAAAQTYDDGKPRSVRFRWMAADGHAVWVQSYFRPIIGENGKVVGLRGVNLDITEQHRAEEFLAFLIESGRTLGSSLDYESTLQNVARLAVPRIADWCSVYLRNDQGDLDEVSLAHVDPERVAWVRRMHEAERLRPGSRNTGPYRVVATGESMLVPEITPEMIEAAVPDEEERRIIHELGLRSYMCVPVSRHGQVLGAVAFVSAESGYRFDDVDLQAAEHLGRRAGAAIENALLYREAEHERARFTSIVASVDYGVCQLDAAGCIEHLNPTAERLLGATTERLSGQPLHDLVHGQLPEGDDCGERGCPVQEVLKSGEVSRGDDTFVTAVGTLLPVRVNCSPILVEGVAAGAVVAFEDITERLEIERRKDDFLAFATHELRNPLTPILGLSRWLDRRVREDPDQYDEEVREAAETLAAEANRMSSIVEVFLDLSRIESNRLVIDPAPVELNGVVVDEARAAELRHPHARVEFDVPAERISVVSDETRVRQVLSNLIENAAKYGGEEPRITISLRLDAEHAIIDVSDEGPGIAEEDQPHIFERFYRSTSGPARTGFGVGLFLTKEVVEQLGGRISFASEPGRGADFRVSLPLRVPMGDEGTARV